MTTAKKSRSKKAGKSSGGHKSPPSQAGSERKRKSNTGASEASTDSRMPKLDKSEVGGGERGGGSQLH
jgi:hypothetical protein